MSAQASLFKDVVKPSLLWCACGHHAEQHADLRRECEYGRETKFGGCTCKKFVPRGRPPVPQAPSLAPPLGATILMRPDTVRPKAMGWAFGHSLVEPVDDHPEVECGYRLTVYLDHLRTKSPNSLRRFWAGNVTQQVMRQQQAMIAQQNRSIVTRTQCAIEENMPTARPWRVRSIRVTRISTGKLDGDGLQGALKYVRDGIADALRCDDREFDNGLITYDQRPPGKRGVFGVMIVCEWGGK